MLNVILDTTLRHHLQLGQNYIAHLYLALFSTTYYGLFRVGELTDSQHIVKVCDVHIGSNKNKVLFVLRSSKTHGMNMFPQIIKIVSHKQMADIRWCPFDILREYL